MPGGCLGWDSDFSDENVGWRVFFFNAPNFETDAKLKHTSNINSSK